MIAFTSSTPHQTWNAILMAKKLFPEEKCDLFLFDECAHYDKIADELRKTDVFENVYSCKVTRFMCHEVKNSLQRKVKKLTYFIFWKQFLKKYAPVEKKYDKVFLASNDEPRCFILSRMKQLSPQLEAFYYEDGANDYISNPHPKHTGKKLRFAKLVGLDYGIGDNIRTTYVAEPSCVVTDEYELERIPSVDVQKDRELVELLNRVFGCKPYPIKEKAVFLFSEFSREEMNRINKELVFEFVERYGEDSLLFKDHPRLPAAGYDGIRKFPKEHETLWECISMNTDCSQKILLSVISTSLYIPKFLFGQEPTLIFLYEVIPVFTRPDRYRTFVEFVGRIRETYSDPSKVFVPKTKEELFAFLDGVMNEKREMQ